MIRSCEIHFPCREAMRCFLTDKERGMRLSVTKDGGGLVYSKNRNVDEEWYVTMEDVPVSTVVSPTTTTAAPSPSSRIPPSSTVVTPTKKKRVVRFRSVKYGVYLTSTKNGKAITTTSAEKGSIGTQWIMSTSFSKQPTTKTTTISPPPAEAFAMSPSSNRQRQQFFAQEDSRFPPTTPPLPSRSRARTHSSGGSTLSLQRSSSQSVDSPDKSGSGTTGGHAGLFILCSENNENYPLRYTSQGQFVTRASNNDDDLFLDEHDDNCDKHGQTSYDKSDDDAIIWWEMEYTSGELCFLSNPTIDQRLRCDFLGKLSLSDKWKGWEVFRFIEATSSSIAIQGEENATGGGSDDKKNGDLIITSWTHHTKVLASDPDGNVFTTENKLGHWERWRVLKAPNGDGVWIQSVAHGRMLCAQLEQPNNRIGKELQNASNAVRQQVNDTGDKLRTFKDNLVQNIQNNLAKEQSSINNEEEVDATSSAGISDGGNIVLGKLQSFRNSLVQRAASSLSNINSPIDPQHHPALQQSYQQQQLQRQQQQEDRPFWQSYRLHTTTKTNDPKCKWHIEAAHSHVYYLTSPCHNQQLASDKHGPFLTSNRKDWEQWKIERVSQEVIEGQICDDDGGCFTLKSVAHSKYLGSTSSGDVHTTSHPGRWSLWEIDESSHYAGSVHIVSRLHHRQLATDDKGRLSTSYQGNLEWKSWRLEPCLPSSMSGTQVAAMATAGAVGLALTVATPFAVVGAVEAAGLTATRVALGFTAEAMAGFGGGALLGAGVVGKTAMSLSKQQKPNYSESNKDDDGTNAKTNNSKDVSNDGNYQLISSSTDIHEDMEHNAMRPLSAWRNW